MKKLLLCMAFLLTGMLAVSCTGGGDATDTTPPADTAAPTEVPTETPTEEVTETPTEAPTEAPFDPLAFEPADLPVANIAREGFALGSATKNDEGYSNLNLNDGDFSTGFSTPWAKNSDAAKEYYFFLDLTSVKVLDSVKVYLRGTLPDTMCFRPRILLTARYGCI